MMKVVRGELLREVSGILFGSHVNIKWAFFIQRVQSPAVAPALTLGGLGTCCHLDADGPCAGV